jgi:hypothetical protein
MDNVCIALFPETPKRNVGISGTKSIRVGRYQEHVGNVSTTEIMRFRTLAGAKSPLVTLRSVAMTTPSLAKIPTQVPALLMASMAYSTWWSRPSGEKVVVEESYRRAMVVVWCFGIDFVPKESKSEGPI